jgi:hypothetical protein
MTRQSNDVNHLAAALVAFQAEMGTVPKESVNPFFKSTYADLAACVKAATPLATTHGIAVTQHIGMGYLTTRLWHASGQWIEEDAELAPIKDHDPQAQGSAITYMRRYAYCAALGIVADKDDDGNAASKPGTSFSAPRTHEEVNGEPIPLDVPMQSTRSGPVSDLPTDKQRNYAKALLKGAGLETDEQIKGWFEINVMGAWPGSLANITKAQCSQAIDLLKP